MKRNNTSLHNNAKKYEEFYTIYANWVRKYVEDHSANLPYEAEIKFYFESLLPYGKFIIPEVLERFSKTQKEITIYDLGCGSGVLTAIVAMHLLEKQELTEAINEGKIRIKGIDILDYSFYWNEVINRYIDHLQDKPKKIDISFTQADYFKVLKSEDLKNSVLIMSKPHDLVNVVDIASIIKNKNYKEVTLFFDYHEPVNIINKLKRITGIKEEKIEILRKGYKRIDAYKHPTIHDLEKYYFVWHSASH